MFWLIMRERMNHFTDIQMVLRLVMINCLSLFNDVWNWKRLSSDWNIVIDMSRWIVGNNEYQNSNIDIIFELIILTDGYLRLL